MIFQHKYGPNSIGEAIAPLVIPVLVLCIGIGYVIGKYYF